MMNRRRFLAASALSASGLALGAAAGLARAQAVNRPARILVGYPPGGSIDAVARVIAEKLRGSYAPSVVVDNRAGNRAAVVMQALMSAPTDGSTFIMAPHSIATVWPHVYKNLSYDALKDIQPVSMVSFFDFAFVVRADVPATTVGEYAQWVKTNPKQNGLFGITGAIGGTPHFVGLLFAQSAGIELTPVPYKGTVQGIQDLLGGQTPAWVGPLGDIERFHSAGKVRVLATTGTRRSKFVPQVPTFIEAGHKDVVWQERFGIWLRGGASPTTVQALNRSVREALDSADVKAMCEKFTSEASGSTPEQFDTIIRQEHARWGRIIRSTGYTPED
jgi:tripartite-type tricarboxylate transporter receptor subunit TctC